MLTEPFATPGDEVVVVSGMKFGQPGTTNSLRVVRCGSTVATTA